MEKFEPKFTITNAINNSLAQIERVRGFLRLGYVKNKSSDLVKAEIIRLLKDYNVYTITYDNGKEFADHYGVNAVLESKSYFCHPYSAWERGSN